MSEQDILTADKFQLRKMVASVLGWQQLEYEGETLYGMSPIGVAFPIPTPRWERDLIDSLDLVAHFRERHEHKDEYFKSMTYLNLEIWNDLSGGVEWCVNKEYHRHGFDNIKQDGPLAICKAFLQAMAQLDEALAEDV